MLALDSVMVVQSCQCELNQPANLTIQSCAMMADHQPQVSPHLQLPTQEVLKEPGLVKPAHHPQPAFLPCTGQLPGSAFLFYTGQQMSHHLHWDQGLGAQHDQALGEGGGQDAP